MVPVGVSHQIYAIRLLFFSATCAFLLHGAGRHTGHVNSLERTPQPWQDIPRGLCDIVRLGTSAATTSLLARDARNRRFLERIRVHV